MLLMRMLTTGHVRLESVFTPGSLRDVILTQARQKWAGAPTVEAIGGIYRPTNSTRKGQEVVENLPPILKL